MIPKERGHKSMLYNEIKNCNQLVTFPFHAKILFMAT